MRPLDPELIRRSGAIRGALAVTVLTGCIAAAASVVQAGAAAAVITHTFLEHRSLDVRLLALLGGAWAVRSLATTFQDVWARRAGLRAVAVLRQELARSYAGGDASDAAMLALLGRGVDALEVYVARYLPQLVLATLVPVGLGAWILHNDVWSAVVLAITIPLIPVFMALIGWFTDAAVRRQWVAVGRITDVINDLFTGLPDLVIFDRARAQADLIRTLGRDATNATMRVLRVSFISSFALELIATISVAIMALGIGLRLTDGGVGLETGLMVLILAPEVYLPLRLVGTQFHAAIEGVEAWNLARPVLESAPRARPDTIEDAHRIALDALVCGYGAPLHAPITVDLTPGTLIAITGRSGAGKSTLLRTIAGLRAPLEGAVLADGRPTTDFDERSWFSHVVYVPQDPWLGHGSVREALTRGSSATDAECHRVLGTVGLDGLSLDARIDDLGTGVSVGQRRRIALARARLRGCDLLLLDEPTAAVDAASEAAILELLTRWRAEGTTIIAVAHRPALVAAADRVLHLGGER